MAKHTSLLTKNTAFEHKFHVDTRKWRPNTIPRSKNPTLFGQKQLDLEGNIEQTCLEHRENLRFHLLSDQGTSKPQKRFVWFKGLIRHQNKSIKIKLNNKKSMNISWVVVSVET
jgi:hypothetical protein